MIRQDELNLTRLLTRLLKDKYWCTSIKMVGTFSQFRFGLWMVMSGEIITNDELLMKSKVFKDPYSEVLLNSSDR
jgi:hypothetical protein